MPAVATVDLVVVGGSQAVCAGASVSLQCTLTGNILVWQTENGDINLVRGLHTSSSSGTYQWQLEELDENELQSTITFVVNNEVTINCSTPQHDLASITLIIEGSIAIYGRHLCVFAFSQLLYFLRCINILHRSSKCPRQTIDSPGQDH